MGISEQISRQMKEAMKGGDRERLRVLRMLKAELQVAETSGEDYDETAVVKSYARSLVTSAQELEQGGRADRADELRQELQIVREFLPRQMSREEVEELIEQIIEEQDLGPGQIGPVMRTLMSEHRDRVDGGMAQQIAREKLAER